MLEILAGAIIPGAMSSGKWDGKWCLGRHNGDFDAFSTKMVEITPSQERCRQAMRVMRFMAGLECLLGSVWRAVIAAQLEKGETISNVECKSSRYLGPQCMLT